MESGGVRPRGSRLEKAYSLFPLPTLPNALPELHRLTLEAVSPFSESDNNNMLHPLHPPARYFLVGTQTRSA